MGKRERESRARPKTAPKSSRPGAAANGVSTPTIQQLFSGETSCHRCGKKIGAGEYHVYVMAVEYKPEDFNLGDPAGPGKAIAASLCDVCCGETPRLPIKNPWYFEREARADPSAGPASEDVSYRAVSLQGEAERLAAQDDELSAADIEANLNSTNTPSTPQVVEPATEDDLRERMDAFLQSPEAKKMPRHLRAVAGKWAAGETQAQIAKAAATNQSTVSRWLGEAKAYLYNPPRRGMGPKPQRRPAGAELMGEAVCRRCGTAIPAGVDRIVLVLLEVNNSIYAIDTTYRRNGIFQEGPTSISHELATNSGGVCFYCEECVGKISQFTADNLWLPEKLAATDGPLPGSEPKWVAGSRRQFEKEKQDRNAATEESLKKSVPAGDLGGFDAAMPTSPKRGDMLARAASLDSLAADDGRSVDEFIGSHIGRSSATGGSSPNMAEAMRKDKLRKFLDSPRSRGRVGQTAREAARRWLQGESQTAIARSLRVEQSTVSRMINGAMKIADSQE